MSKIQLGKFPLLVAQMIVEVTGLNRLMCRNLARYALVDSDWMALKARFCRLLVFGSSGGDLGPRVISHRPLVRLLWTVIIILPSLIILELYLDKIYVQLSSRIYPIDMRDPGFILFRTWNCCAWSENWCNRWSVVVCIGVIQLPLPSFTVLVLVVGWVLWKIWVCVGLM